MLGCSAIDGAGDLTAVRRQPLIPQVFISHTGQDEGAKSFATSVLKPALEAAGVDVFMDFSNLTPGCEWPQELINAAANSQVVVVVLSKTYIRRFWCMLELDLALNAHRDAAAAEASGHRPLIIPVFYDSFKDGVDVQQMWQRRLEPGQGESNEEEAAVPAERQPWVHPERWAANLVMLKKRLQFLQLLRAAPAAKDEPLQVAKRVVAEAVKALPRQVDIGVDVVGAEQQEAELTAELCPGTEGVVALWLHGSGGHGKTVMARLLFNRLAPAFSHTAFLPLDLNDTPQQQQQHLVSLLKQLGARDFGEHQAPDLLRQILNKFVKDKAVLLVVDNIWYEEQLDELLPKLGTVPSFGAGSRLLFTSRHADLPRSRVLKAFKNAPDKLLKRNISLLAPDFALQLFRQHTNLHAPTGQVLQWETDIVKACAGLPLALQVLGGQLCTDDEELWKEVHYSFVQCSTFSPADDTETKLQSIVSLSFAKLQKEAQSMFLDCVSVLHGQDSKQAEAVWKAWWPGRAIRAFGDLQRSTLVSIDDKGRLVVHDVIRLLGRTMLQDPSNAFYGSRVWVGADGQLVEFPEQGARQPLLAVSLEGATDMAWGSDPVVDGTGWNWPTTKALQGYDLSALRIVISRRVWLQPLVASAHLLWYKDDGTDQERYSEQLGVPMQLDLRGLVVLQVNIDTIWSKKHTPACHEAERALQSLLHGSKPLHTLRLKSYYVLTQLPDSFGQLSALQHLVLVMELQELPDSFGQLSALQHLELIGFDKLQQLPDSFGQLSALQHLELHLGGCQQLQQLPDSFGKLSALQHLDLCGCQQLQQLPASFGQLSALQHLDLCGCQQLQQLPASFGQLSALQHLEMAWCQLQQLPDSFGQLPALQHLEMAWCQLQQLPASFGQLSALQHLELSWCLKLQQLPDSFGQLSALQHLDLRGCHKLQLLPDSFGQLSALQHLDLCECQQLQQLPASFGQLSALQHLDLCECQQLQQLPDSFGQLPALQHLDLVGCDRLDQQLPASLRHAVVRRLQ